MAFKRPAVRTRLSPFQNKNVGLDGLRLPVFIGIGPSRPTFALIKELSTRSF